MLAGGGFLGPIYLSPNHASRAKYPAQKYPADVEVDTLEDGVARVPLCEEPFENNDAEGMAQRHALEGALRPIQS